MHDMSLAEGIATAVVNPRIRLSVQLTNILMQPRHLGGESLGPTVVRKIGRGTGRNSKWIRIANFIPCNCCDGFNLACTAKLDACTIVARGIMICVLCCMHDMSFAEGIATAVVNPRI